MTAQRRLTDADRQNIATRYAQGESMRTIARHTGWSLSTISKAVRDAGVPTDTTRTDAATATVKARADADRIDRAERLLRDAEELRRGLFDPIREPVNTSAGVAWIERDPNPREQLATVNAIGRLVDQSERLLALVDDQSLTTQKSVLDRLMAGLQAAVNRDQNG